MKDRIEGLSTDYYQVLYSLKSIENNLYEAQAVVTRKDTGEETRLFFCEYGGNIENIEHKIYQSLLEKASFLAKQPADWNSKTKKLLAELNVLENHKVAFHVELEKSISNGVSEEFIKESYGSFLNLIIEKTKQLVIGIEELDSNDRKSLLISDEYVYENPTDPWNLDDLTLRYRIFKFFNNPSIEEIQLHHAHIEKKRGKPGR